MSSWSPACLAPGALAALCALLLLAALRRWYDPLPAAAALLYGLLVALLLGPALFAGRVLLPLDLLRGYPPFEAMPPSVPHGNFLQLDLVALIAPSLDQVRDALAMGRWPLWNPDAGAGLPLLADPQAQCAQPLVLAGLGLPVIMAVAVIAALRILVALCFMHLFLRREGLGAGPAMLGALAYGLGGFVQLWLGWPLATVAALLPATLYAVVRVIERGERRDAVLLAASTTALLLSGHPETTLYVLALGIGIAAGRLRRLAGPARRRRAALAAAAALVAAGVAAPVLLPAANYLPQTLRAALVRDLRAADRAAGPLGGAGAPADWAREAKLRLLPIAAPNAFGNDRYLAYWGAENVNEDASGFVGSATILLALLALIGPRGGATAPSERLLLAGAALALVIVARPPGTAWLMSFLPLPLQSSSHHHRILLVLGFAVCHLAASATERWSAPRLPAAASPGRERITAALVAVGLALLLSWAYLASPHPLRPETLLPLTRGSLALQLKALAVGLAWALAPRGLRRATLPLLGLAIATELALLHAPANPALRVSFAALRPPPVVFLEQHLGAARLVGAEATLPPNVASLLGLADLRVYNPMEPVASYRLTRDPASLLRGGRPRLRPLDDPLLAELGVRFALTRSGATLPAPWRRVLADPAGWVWERPDAAPVVQLAAAADATGPPPRELVIERREPARVTLERPAGPPVALRASIVQDGGWRLLAGGRPVDAGKEPFVRGALPATAAPQTLELLYRPPGFLAGMLLAALGLGLGAAAWLPPPAGRLRVEAR